MKTVLEQKGDVSARKRYTYEDLSRELEETNQPIELWDGEIVVSPSPTFWHQKIVSRFFKSLDRWVEDRDLGQVVTAPIDLVLSPHCAVQPDVVFVAKDRLSIVSDTIRGPADLVAEVVSLGGRRRDRFDKKDLYEQHGIREYWIIDPEAKSVDVFKLEARQFQLHIRAGRGEIARSAILEGFAVEVDELLRPVKDTSL